MKNTYRDTGMWFWSFHNLRNLPEIPWWKYIQYHMESNSDRNGPMDIHGRITSQMYRKFLEKYHTEANSDSTQPNDIHGIFKFQIYWKFLEKILCVTYSKPTKSYCLPTKFKSIKSKFCEMPYIIICFCFHGIWTYIK